VDREAPRHATAHTEAALHDARHRSPLRCGDPAHFGSFEAWRAIDDCTTFTVPEPSRTPSYLEHGFDEEKAPEDWDRTDYVHPAEFRGGELVRRSFRRRARASR
jgi:hypothetical protein